MAGLWKSHRTVLRKLVNVFPSFPVEGLGSPAVLHRCRFCAVRKCEEKTTDNQVVLGIETSCDDTGAAVVSSDGQVLGQALATQQDLHLRHGGIIPTLARQLHEDNIQQVVDTALAEARISPQDLTAVAATVKPGMALPLSVGVQYGKALALAHNKPFIPVHHMEAHALTARMLYKIDFPFLVLLVSGGHCLVVLARALHQWSIIGSTLDDAPGEALDKGARRLKLRNLPECASMSGGRAVEHLARSGDPLAFTFPSPLLQHADCSFSFAGLKQCLFKIAENLEGEHGVVGGQVVPQVNDVCASFQHAITGHLLRRTHKAMVYVSARHLLPPHAQTLVVSGGVACNQYIRGALQRLCDTAGYQLIVPPPHLCTDNGIMIAWNGMERWLAQKGVLYNREEIEAVRFEPRAPMGEDLSEDVRTLRIKAPKAIKF
ncbi:hypothetical protein Pcinc_008632 [Petrolisthes cinctipes]|uniref:N(6)-L-threonylcarbamoyladenine synthase n=1 Tax=Petrolisthes cinctipes TaxID=88211 RepID=A0AAE1G6V6_PETCI|nr:hypothetical protein Pcinc_008632 [Petrolisthes cinctipes]